MKKRSAFKFKRCVTMLLSIIMVMSLFPLSALAVEEVGSLTPDDREYKDGVLAPEGEEGDIVLHKQAERIAADEWKVNVSAFIKEEPIEVPELEVAFVLDASKRMYPCVHEDVHKLGFHVSHVNCDIICGNADHEHEDSCYICGNTIQIHSDRECSYLDKATGDYVAYPTRFDVASGVITNMVNKLPEYMKNYYKPLFFQKEKKAYEWRLVKAADKLSALIKCIEELKMGNREFEVAEKTIREVVIDLN